MKHWIVPLSLISALCFAECPCKNKQQPQPQVVQPPLTDIQIWNSKMTSLYPEMRGTNSSLKSLRFLELVLEGSDKSYQELAAKLSKESFQALHQQGAAVLNMKGFTPVEMKQAIETALVLKDLGSNGHARNKFRQIRTLQSEEFYGEALQILQNNPHLSSSFSRLSPSMKNFLVKAHLISYNKIVRLEGGPALFSKLKVSSFVEPAPLSFALFVEACRSVYTENDYRAWQAVGNACRLLSNPLKTESDAYEAYVAERASWLGFNPNNQEERVLTRIGAMLGLYTVEEGNNLRNRVMALSAEEREAIAVEFSKEVVGSSDLLAKLK